MTSHLDPETIRRYDELSCVERESFQRHVQGCTTCRLAWLEEDPSRLFGLLATQPIPVGRLDELSARIDRRLDALDSRPQRRFAAISIAASLLLAVLIGSALWSQPRLEPVRAALPLDVEAVSGIRLVSSPGGDAQVFDLAIGETQLLMIFDEAIGL